MIFLGLAWQGVAVRGVTRLYVTQYGNWDNFSGPTKSRFGQARPGRARRGLAGQGNTPAGGRYHRTLSSVTNKAKKAKQHEAN